MKRAYRIKGSDPEAKNICMYLEKQDDGSIYLKAEDDTDDWAVLEFMPKDGKVHLCSGIEGDMFETDENGYILVARDH